jgi:LacI family transcriptional regulator
MAHRISIREIARKAGVHHTTVSMALRNHPELPKETCQRLQALAEKMGYRPDPMLVSLAAYRQSRVAPQYKSTIGIISGHAEPDGWHQGFNVSGIKFYNGIVARSKELGYHIEEFSPVAMKVKPDKLAKILVNRGIRGLIIPPRQRARGFLKLDWTHFSAVTIGYSLVYPELHRVTSNHAGSMVMVLRKLRQLGYRRIGVAIAQEFDERVNRGYSSGYAAGSRLYNEKDLIPWFTLNTTSSELGAFKTWLKKYKPEVIVGLNFQLTNWIFDMGLKIPEDYAFVHLNLTYVDGKSPDREKITTGIYQKQAVVGAAAIDLLSGMIQRNECGIPEDPKIMLVQGAWIAGETAPSRLKS